MIQREFLRACSKRNPDLIYVLKDICPDYNAVDKYNNTALNLIIKNTRLHNKHVFIPLIAPKTNLSIADDYGRTPFINAIRLCDLAIIQQVDNNDIHQKDEHGDTPLHHACYRPVPDIQVIRYLINNGANVNARNNENKTPADTYNTQVLKVLLEYDLDINKFNDNTILFRLVSANENTMFKYVLQHASHMDINKQYDHGDTLLHQTCKNNNNELTLLLLDQGVNVFIHNKNGKFAHELIKPCHL